MSGGNDINPKIGLEYSEFKKGITELNRNIRVIESEFKAASAGMDDWKNSSEGLESKIKSLTGTGEEHRKKLELMEEQLKKVTDQKGKASAGAKNLEARINSERAALNKNEKELKECENALKGYKDGTLEAEEATQRLTARVEKLNQAGSNLSRYVTVPIMALVGATTKWGLELEATEAKFGTVFGSQREEIQTFIDEWQKLVPITETGARSMASGIQDLLVPMGFMREKATDLTEVGMTLVGAWTNFNNATHTAAEVGTAYQAMLTGEYESMKRLGVQISATTVEQKAYEMGLITSKDQLTTQVKALVATQMAWEQSKDALAAFNESQLDAKTRLEISIAGLKDEGAELGQNFIPMVTKGAETINRMVDAFKEMSPEGKKTILVLGGIAAVAGPVMVVTSKLITAYTIVRTAVMAQNKELDKNTVKTLVNVAAQKGQGSALFKAGLMATGKAAAVSALGIAESAAIPPTYALGAAVRFLTGPWGIALTLIGATVPLLMSFGNQAEETTSDIEGAALATDELNAQLNTLTGSSTTASVDLSVTTTLDTEAAIDELAKYRSETSRTLAEILITAKETEEGITDNVIEEYKKRTDQASLELEKRRAEEIESFLEHAAQLGGLTQVQLNTGLLAINTKYDNELTASENHYATLETVLTDHYDKESGLTEEGWTMLQESYLNGQGSIVKASEVSNQQILDFATTMMGSMNTMTDERLAENVQLSKEYYAQAEANAAATKDAQIAFAEEQRDELGTISAEEAEIKILAAQKQYDDSIYWAGISKDAVINTALETLSQRNQINVDEYTAITAANQGIADEEKRHTDNLVGIKEQYVLDMAAATEWDPEAQKQITTQYNLDLEAEETLHKDSMITLYKEQEEAIGSLDEGTQEAFLNMLTTAEEEGVKITTETQTMVDAMVATVDVTAEMYTAGSNSLQGYVNGLSSKLVELREIVAEIANIPIDDIAKYQQMESPSKVLRKLGGFGGEGYIIGWEDKKSKLKSTIKDFSNIAVTGLSKDFTKNVRSSMAGIDTGLLSDTKSLNNDSFTGSNNTSMISHDNRKTISPSVVIQVQEGIDSFKYRQEANRVLRDQAAIIARG